MIEEEAIIRHAGESLPIENGMIPLRQLVHDQQREDRVNAEKSTVSSNMMGKNAGSVRQSIRLSVHDHRIKNKRGNAGQAAPR